MKVMIMMTQTMPNILMKTIMLVMMLVVVVVMILVVDGFASPVIHYCVFRWEPMVAAMVCRGLPWEPPWDPTVAHVGFHGRPWAPMGAHGNCHGRPWPPAGPDGRLRDAMTAATVECAVSTPAGSRGSCHGNTHVGAHAGAH